MIKCLTLQGEKMDNEGMIMAIETLTKSVDSINNKVDNVQKDVTDIKVGMQSTKDKLEVHEKVICDHELNLKSTECKVNEIQTKINNNQHQGFVDVVKWFFSQPKKRVLWNSILLFIAGLIIAGFILLLIFILGELGVLPQVVTGLFKVIT